MARLSYVGWQQLLYPLSASPDSGNEQATQMTLEIIRAQAARPSSFSSFNQYEFIFGTLLHSSADASRATDAAAIDGHASVTWDVGTIEKYAAALELFDAWKTQGVRNRDQLNERLQGLGSDRRHTPLFADEHGQPYSYFTLNDWLRKILTALIGAQTAAAFSWHSFRIELACLLRAAGCPDSLIQLICRWKCPSSVQKYAQVGTAENVAWLQRAHGVYALTRFALL